MPGLSTHLLRHRRRRCLHLVKTKQLRCVLYASLVREMIGIFCSLISLLNFGSFVLIGFARAAGKRHACSCRQEEVRAFIWLVIIRFEALLSVSVLSVVVE